MCRQNLPVIDDVDRVRAGVAKGAYILSDPSGGAPEAIILSTGSEVSIAIAAQKQLAADGVPARVVSMPSWDLFEAESAAYRESVLPRSIRARVAIEAGSSLGWAKYTGDAGEVIALDHFGASAAIGTLYKEFGLTAEAVAAAVKRSITRATVA